MSKKNSKYWKNRFSQLEAAQNQLGAKGYSEIEKIYKDAQKQIEGQISTWYQRFAVNNGISMGEARQWLTGKDLKEFKWEVQDYIKYGQDNAASGQWVKQLENASVKFHVSKLEALKTHTQQSLESLLSKQHSIISSTLGNVFESGYYHTAYELQKGFNVGFDIGAIDQSYLEKVLSKPWAVDGYNFSERIWKNKDKLISEIHTELSRSIMTGADPQKVIDAISKKLNVSKNNAGRLVMTEEAYFSSVAQQQCFNDLDVEEYEIVATLDSHTSAICQNLDGQVFSMKDYEAGVTAPPFHVNCRSTTAPHFSENFGQIGERAARDEATGETYYIPDDITYKDWKAAFVDGGDKTGLIINNGLQNENENDIISLTKDTSVVEGQNLVGEYVFSGDFEYPIEDIIHTQGYDGAAKVFPYEDFKQAMEESNFYAERTYSAPNREQLEQWRQELYSGKWYVDCSTGGAQYGQGMYCAACYDLADTKSLGGLAWEMSHYQQLGIKRGNLFSYTEGITIDKSAKILTLPYNKKADEFISDIYTNAYITKYALKNQKSIVKEYIDVSEKISELTLKESESVINALYERRNKLGNQIKMLLNDAVKAQMYVDKLGHTKFKNPGVLAAEMGYDVINAVGHGESGSYTVILNRTKLIFCEGGSIYGN